MKAIRKGMLAAWAAMAVLPTLGAAAQPATQPGQGDMERRLAEARARLEQAASEVARLSSELGRRFAYELRLPGGEPPARALLGIVVDTPDDSKDGAHVRDVSPGGAAAEAGIKPGDVITNIGARDLTREPDPGRALVDLMRQAEPNLKLHVDVVRDGKKLAFDVTPRPAPQNMMGQIRVLPGMPGAPGERRIEIRTVREGPDDGTRFRGLEFATMSEKLGSYFGVKSGVLVVRAGATPAFQLQDGDVILAIDGREPTSAQHAARILRSYADGEKFTLRVQRERKARNIEVTMPRGGPEDIEH
jgi:S1-C subfamily serine protease